MFMLIKKHNYLREMDLIFAVTVKTENLFMIINIVI